MNNFNVKKVSKLISKCLVAITYLIGCFAIVQIDQNKMEFSLSLNVRYLNPFDTMFAVSNMGCAASCMHVDVCASINYQESTSTCEHNRLIPDFQQPDGAPGWVMISVKLSEPASMIGTNAWQSTTFETYTADLAIDGNTDGNFNSRSCAHTYDEGTSYFAVELPYVALIGSVTIHLRTDCCTERSAKLRLMVYLTRDDFDTDTGIECAYYGGPPTAQDSPLNIQCAMGTFGKIFKIQHEQPVESYMFLQLCEVFVNPYPVSMIGANAWQSTTFETYTADLAIDGNTDGNFNSGSCAHTYDEGTSYFVVELPYVALIGSVTIHLRTDCCTATSAKLRLIVYVTRDDFDTNTGTDCAFFEGPPTAQDSPLNMQCTFPIFGKIIKIQHQQRVSAYMFLQLCEVIVYSP